MAEVQIPLLDAQIQEQHTALSKLRDARTLVENLGLLTLAKGLAEIEDRLRATTFRLEVAGARAKLIASVPD